MSEVVMIIGYPASGKSRESEKYIAKGHVYLNRDTEGKRVIDLVPKMEIELSRGKNVVLDNTFPTRESRAPFIRAAKKAGAKIHAVVMGTTLEDAQINSLDRMYKRYGKLFLNGERPDVADPNIFPIAVLFNYRKESEGHEPDISEGFDSLNSVKFERQVNPEYKNKALILDYDDTLRRSLGPQGYPTNPAEIEILPGRKEKLQEYVDKGYLLLGVSNQSGIAKKILSDADACACFDHTNKLLGHSIDYCYCPHSVPPTCYCRKPQSGLGVHLIHKYRLDPKQCIFVGDQTTDKTFAKRLGFKYIDQKDFF